MPILLVRHGNTSYDSKVDAFLDPPLDKKGVDRIKRTKKFLVEQDLRPHRIIVSPRQRTVKTAAIIGGGSIRIQPQNALLPWNLGDLQGRESREIRSTIQYFKDYPDLKVPHGESYRRFYLRWTGFLRQLMQWSIDHPEKLIMLVTHSRNINSLQELIDGNPIGDVKEVAQEGSVTLLAENGVNGWSHEIVWEGI